jgi:carotenoid 1,2-hydratase
MYCSLSLVFGGEGTGSRMHSVELLNRNAHPDGWHDIRSPGGYEWWYFDAEDAATDTQIVAIFMQGFVFHPEYLRRYARFVRRPTLTSPPVAADYPCVYLCVYHGGTVHHQLLTQYPRDAFRAEADRVSVTIGPNQLWQDEGGTYRMSITGTPWKLTAHGPQQLRDSTLSADLSFAPTQHVTSTARRFLSSEMTGADHEWIIAAPRCDVAGMIAVSGPAAGDARAHAVSGRGYHDHNYGTAPIGKGLARWIWGRAMFGDDRLVTFHHAESKDRSLAAETHLVEAGAGGMQDVPVDLLRADWSLVSNPALRLRYPRSLDFGDALRLSEPRVIDPSPFYLRLQFAAESYGEKSTAFCEIAYPHRLRWPVLGRMIEMSFDKRPLDGG